MTAHPELAEVSAVTAERGGREVLHGIDLVLRQGQVVALMGPNGAGKSTLLDVIGGSLHPTTGTVTLSGRVAVALQSPDLANRSVIANVKLALAWWGVPRAERPQRATEALRAIDAAHLADRHASALSGGERRRVHLARAMAVRPDLLMLDEPFAGLDASTRAGLLDDTGTALRTTAAGALVVVHDRAEAWALADRLLIMIAGRIVADGPPRMLLEQPPTLQVARFLGFDGTFELSGGAVIVTRPAHVRVDPDGAYAATVTRVVPLEDGVRLVLASDRGELYARTDDLGPASGDRLRFNLTGGASFDSGGQPTPLPWEAAHSRSPYADA
jgi:ABC-type sulfate/molybdate transport systems ATPase subunit